MIINGKMYKWQSNTPMNVVEKNLYSSFKVYTTAYKKA